jgi:polyisoprenoid-binding protein YceI
MNDINTNNVALKAGKYFLPKTADAYFSVDGVIAFIAKANTAANVAITTTQQQIKGGQANSVIGVITSEKAINVSFTTPEWQPEFLAANIGTTIRFGDQNFYIDDVTYTVAEGKITLAEVPANEKIQIELNGGWVTVPATTTTVDLSAYSVADGECLSVIGLFPRKGKEISLLVDTDPTIGELVLKSPIFKGTVGKVGIAQYTFPSFSLSGNWTQNFAADASYEITGTPIAVAGEKCGESETYGYYREYIDGDTLDNFTSIVATPSVVELAAGETQQLSVYGIRNALSEKSELTEGVTFAIAEDGEATATVTATGLVEAVATGSTTITVTYGEGKYTTTVAVNVE